MFVIKPPGTGDLDDSIAAVLDSMRMIAGTAIREISSRRSNTIEAAAAMVVNELVSLQPSGSFRLLGVGDGGLVAYEVAAQLLGRGANIGFLGMFDTPASPRRSSWASIPRAADYLSRRLAQGALEVAPALDDQSESFADLIPRYKDVPFVRDLLERHSPEQISDLFECLSLRGSAADDYVIESIPVAIHHFVTSARMAAHSPDLGWSKTTMSDRICNVPLPDGAKDALGLTILNTIHEVDGADTLQVPVEPIPKRWIPITSSSALHSVFCIPGAGGNATAFAAFAGVIGPRSLFASQPRGLDLSELPHYTVEAAAAELAQELIEEHQANTVHLVGHSFGGWVAFETARQLLARGKSVNSLTLIDTRPPGEIPREFTHLEVLVVWIQILEQISGRSLGIRIKTLDQLDPLAQLELIHQRVVDIGLLPRRSRPDILSGALRTFAAAIRCNYNPNGRYPDRVRLVLADGTSSLLQGPARGPASTEWQQWAPESEIWRAPGNHMTILNQPHVKTLGEWWMNVTS